MEKYQNWAACVNAANESPSLVGDRKRERAREVLLTLIDKQTKQNRGKVFSCFVDLKKAFDSIWPEGLLYQLKESGDWENKQQMCG